MPDEDPVLASEPVEWAAEFRFFVRDRRVRAWSPYWLHGALARTGRRVGRRARDGGDDEGAGGSPARRTPVDLPVALVLDAGVIKGRGPAVVEANEASGSGIYGCDPRDVLEVLRAATRRLPE